MNVRPLFLRIYLNQIKCTTNVIRIQFAKRISSKQLLFLRLTRLLSYRNFTYLFDLIYI